MSLELSGVEYLIRKPMRSPYWVQIQHQVSVPAMSILWYEISEPIGNKVGRQVVTLVTQQVRNSLK